MSELQFVRVVPVGGEDAVRDWQHIHNLIIPAGPLSLDEIVLRATRNHLEVAYLDGSAVGCSTVRPSTADTSTYIVIARVLPQHRRQGHGRQIYARGLEKARELGAKAIESVVLASNEDGLRFAQRHGFVEVDRYVLPGDSVAYVDLRLRGRLGMRS